MCAAQQALLHGGFFGVFEAAVIAVVLREKIGICELGFVPRRVAHNHVKAALPGVCRAKGFGKGDFVVKEMPAELVRGNGFEYAALAAFALQRAVEQGGEQVGGFVERFHRFFIARGQQHAPGA